jgi:hypothetical protein
MTKWTKNQRLMEKTKNQIKSRLIKKIFENLEKITFFYVLKIDLKKKKSFRDKILKKCFQKLENLFVFFGIRLVDLVKLIPKISNAPLIFQNLGQRKKSKKNIKNSIKNVLKIGFFVFFQLKNFQDKRELIFFHKYKSAKISLLFLKKREKIEKT